MDSERPEGPDPIGEMLLRELRGAVEARRRAGDDPVEITADLTGRLHRVRALRAEQADRLD
ncbi:hypothetical protein [Dactylosporangium darangshiense]|uniref:Uncharacterized protein n=1 Tax=Dactylosporangium darangshiense TaxID=579108 RepID=A0ABP8DHP2_9ACTN